MQRSAKKIAFLGVSVSLALILAYVESLLPPIYAAVPGVKMGLPNIVIIFILYRFGVKEAAAVSFVRIVAASLLFGSTVTFAYSMAGGILSLVAMAILRRLDLLSAVGVSVAGGVLHNVGQILTAILLLGRVEIGYYLVVLAITGVISGVIVGLCGSLVIKRFQTKNTV